MRLALLSKGSFFGAEGILEKSPRSQQARVVSTDCVLFLLSREAFLSNRANLKLDRLFKKDLVVIKEWRKAFLNKIIGVQEKMITKTKEFRLESPKPSSNEKEQFLTTEKPFIKVTLKNKQERALSQIIKSREYSNRILSERDELSLIQAQISHKEDVFIKKNPINKDYIDLSLEGQRARLMDLLNKRLQNYQKNGKRLKAVSLYNKPKLSTFYNENHQISIFPNENPSFKKSSLAEHLNIRLKRKKPKAVSLQKPFFNINIDLTPCFKHL